MKNDDLPKKILRVKYVPTKFVKIELKSILFSIKRLHSIESEIAKFSCSKMWFSFKNVKAIENFSLDIFSFRHVVESIYI